MLSECDVLLAFKFKGRAFPRAAILELPRLRWLQLASAGADHVAPYDPSRITVTNASGIHGAIMSEYVFGMLVHQMWDVPRLLRQQAEHRWESYLVPSLVGRTIAVIGAGHIGTSIAARARAFGLRVLAVRRSGRPVPEADETFQTDAIPEVVGRADIVVITLPLTPDTRGCIDRDALERLKCTAYLINISRGGVVDEEALLDRLRRRPIAGAVLDVFQREPLPSDSPFWALPGVVVTPHISSEVLGWPEAVARLFVDNLRRWTAGGALSHVVEPQLGY
ncbi:MAG: D-2-hydroxyacid dehydrogenase [Chloroflexi bacterium]|nr:D-2-hydroxyacid dehydrogenase [Chloroflexota bacterium]